MKAFCARLSLFLLLQGLFFFLLVRNPELPEENNYLAATMDKHQRLERMEPPRLILVGGSNVAFGFRSETLEEEVGMPVVNMGLVGGLGVEFMLNEVEGAIGRGDVVLLSFEYDLLSGGDSELIFRQIVELRPENFRHVPWRSWKDLITDHGTGVLGGIVRKSLGTAGVVEEPGETIQETAYRRRYFDAAGGYVGHHGSETSLASVEPGRQLLGSMPVRAMSESVYRRLEEFAELCARRGAECFYTCPPHPKELLDSKRELIEANWARLGTIHGLTLLDRPEEQTYPLGKFFDTGYHLTARGAYERTMDVSRRLKAYQRAAQGGLPLQFFCPSG
jgi:hypothetical protein